MSAGRVGTSLGAKLDWARVLERCGPQARKSIMDLRSRHEELRRQILETQSAAQIRLDFDYYRRKLAGTEHETLLNKLESELKGFQPAKVDISQKLRELEQEKQSKMREASDFLVKLEAEIAQLKEHLEKLRAAKPIDQMTVEDVYQLNPQLRNQIYENIKTDNWATQEDQTAAEVAETGGKSGAHH